MNDFAELMIAWMEHEERKKKNMTCLDCVNCVRDYNAEPYCVLYGHLDDEDLKYEHSENCFEFHLKELCRNE